MELKSRWFSILMIIAALYVIGVSMLFFYNTILFLKNSYKTTGVIDKFKSKQNSAKSKFHRKLIYAPIINYKDQNGQSKSFESITYFAKKKFSKGDTVKIIVSSKYPFGAINNFKSIWLLPCCSLIFGIVLMIMGVTKSF